MKTYYSLKYLVFAGALSLWGCNSQQYTQSAEYDDLYFSSKDREQVTLTASAASKDYSTIENKGEVVEDNSQKNVNPEYIQQYAEESRRNSGTNGNDSYDTADSYSTADNASYYDENYNRKPIDLARGYNYNSNAGTNINVFPSVGFGGFYGSSAFYDPFYDPYFHNNAYYDPFFHRPFYGRPGWNISISYNYGWGSPWGWGRPYGGSYWNDPYYSYRGWGYDPFYGNGYYGWNNYYGWNRWNRGGNVIIINPSNGNNNDPRQVRYSSPRNGRSSGVVNDDFNNTPRTSRGTRSGRIDQSAGTSPSNNDYSNNNSNRRPSNISSDESRPARAVRPRSNANPDYQPQTTQPEYTNPGGRSYSPNVNSGNNSNTDSYSNPRAVRPRSNSSDYPANNRNNNYYDNNNTNRSSAPSYNNTPSTGRSPRSYDNSRSNNNWNNSSNDSYRSNGNFNNNSNSSGSGSYSSPSQNSSPRGGSNSGGSNSSGSSPRRSPR